MRSSPSHLGYRTYVFGASALISALRHLEVLLWLQVLAIVWILVGICKRGEVRERFIELLELLVNQVM